MSKATSALRKNCTISHGLQLYGYFISRKLRKNLDIYEFENSFISKYKAYKDFKLLEKSFKDETPPLKSKKIVKLL